MLDHESLLEMLELARWAPSGDNTQPWRFEIVSDRHIAIHGSDTRDWCVYDFKGRASHMAHGALLETLRIAATAKSCTARWKIRPDRPDTAPIYDVFLQHEEGLQADSLLGAIRERVVQRRPMRLRPLTCDQRKGLSSAVGDNFELQFFESFSERFAVARLLWSNAKLRLTCPEAYAVHARVIEWGAQYSEDRIPDQAVGVDPLTAKLMQWVMGSWSRVEFFNRYLFGTIAPRIQLDFIPAIACGAHILMRPKAPLDSLEAYLEAGCAMQRLWLKATTLGLSLQPEMTPVIFRWYACSQCSLSSESKINSEALRLAESFDNVIGAEDARSNAFFCRVGTSAKPQSRSLRLGLDRLMHVPERA
ncbi:MAG: nitroreductase family protein [Zoogloeaceae bacterium]|nr:nitroreductase family protein [Zoogloeaceae bacterium]